MSNLVSILHDAGFLTMDGLLVLDLCRQQRTSKEFKKLTARALKRPRHVHLTRMRHFFHVLTRCEHVLSVRSCVRYDPDPALKVVKGLSILMGLKHEWQDVIWTSNCDAEMFGWYSYIRSASSLMRSAQDLALPLKVLLDPFPAHALVMNRVLSHLEHMFVRFYVKVAITYDLSEHSYLRLPTPNRVPSLRSIRLELDASAKRNMNSSYVDYTPVRIFIDWEGALSRYGLLDHESLRELTLVNISHQSSEIYDVLPYQTLHRVFERLRKLKTVRIEGFICPKEDVDRSQSNADTDPLTTLIRAMPPSLEEFCWHGRGADRLGIRRHLFASERPLLRVVFSNSSRAIHVNYRTTTTEQGSSPNYVCISRFIKCEGTDHGRRCDILTREERLLGDDRKDILHKYDSYSWNGDQSVENLRIVEHGIRRRLFMEHEAEYISNFTAINRWTFLKFRCLHTLLMKNIAIVHIKFATLPTSCPMLERLTCQDVLFGFDVNPTKQQTWLQRVRDSTIYVNAIQMLANTIYGCFRRPVLKEAFINVVASFVHLHTLVLCTVDEPHGYWDAVLTPATAGKQLKGGWRMLENIVGHEMNNILPTAEDIFELLDRTHLKFFYVWAGMRVRSYMSGLERGCDRFAADSMCVVDGSYDTHPKVVPMSIVNGRAVFLPLAEVPRGDDPDARYCEGANRRRAPVLPENWAFLPTLSQLQPVAHEWNLAKEDRWEQEWEHASPFKTFGTLPRRGYVPSDDSESD